MWGFGMREWQKVNGGEKCVWVKREPVEIEIRDINKKERCINKKKKNKKHYLNKIECIIKN